MAERDGNISWWHRLYKPQNRTCSRRTEITLLVSASYLVHLIINPYLRLFLNKLNRLVIRRIYALIPYGASVTTYLTLILLITRVICIQVVPCSIHASSTDTLTNRNAPSTWLSLRCAYLKTRSLPFPSISLHALINTAWKVQAAILGGQSSDMVFATLLGSHPKFHLAASKAGFS